MHRHPSHAWRPRACGTVVVRLDYSPQLGLRWRGGMRQRSILCPSALRRMETKIGNAAPSRLSS